jgi:hypothetical protein
METTQIEESQGSNMNKFGEAFQRLQSKRPAMRRASEVQPSEPGFLTSREVCIIWDGPEWATPAMDGPASYARELVAQRQLPLVESEPGRWVVSVPGWPRTD